MRACVLFNRTDVAVTAGVMRRRISLSCCHSSSTVAFSASSGGRPFALIISVAT